MVMYFNERLGVYAGDRQGSDAEATTPQLNQYQAAINNVEAKLASDEAVKASAIVNPVIQYLGSHTPAECIAKVNTDVTDLVSAKIMLGHFAVALCVLVRDKLRG